MIDFMPTVTYLWFPDHVEAQTEQALIKYQIIKDAAEVDFEQYHCGIFEGEYDNLFRI